MDFRRAETRPNIWRLWKMLVILHTFSQMKYVLVFRECPYFSIWQYDSIGVLQGLTTHSQEAIFWSNYEPIYGRMYASHSLNVLTIRQAGSGVVSPFLHNSVLSRSVAMVKLIFFIIISSSLLDRTLSLEQQLGVFVDNRDHEIQKKNGDNIVD